MKPKAEQFQHEHPGQGGPTRRIEMPDIFGGADKKTRPASATILREPGELFSFVRDFANWPRFLRNVKHVEQLTPSTYRWTIATKGEPTTFETEVIQERPGELIAWQTREGAPYQQTAAILLEPAVGGRGTVISYKLKNESVIGKIVGSLSKLALSDPDSVAMDTVRRLKALVETGEVPTTEGQPSGRSEGKGEADEGFNMAG